ncbi:GNAT family N-acetyltransferase [Anaerospora hongkongensis]|uniref:GNAT family N-acetyltransferase n=1 Tax=Anaerospora hongkongensis TaxID=244830 RepID=UPI00289849AE|nr:GNAT family N-acetyltransferase [Anaerospora hongkongensis]
MLTVKKGSKSFYVGDSESAPLAEMIFSADKDVITIEHTFVSDELRGQGAGRQLLQKLAAWVREDHKKIIAVCPFVKKELTKSQEYDDILYQLPR